MNHLAPAAGLNGYLAAALLAGGIALALLAATAGISARRRRLEYVALATVGVTRSALSRAWTGAAAVRLGFATAVVLAPLVVVEILGIRWSARSVALRQLREAAT